MLRNRSRQPDPQERLRKHRQTELLILLEKCSQIAKDDRILLRNLIKEQSQELIALMVAHRRQQDLAELQIELRRFVSAYRSKLNENFEFCRETKRATTRVTSFQGTHRTANVRQSEPLQLRLVVDQNTGIIRKTDADGRINTASQYQFGGFDSRPSEATYKKVVEPDPTIMRIRFEKEVELEIDREIQRELEDLTIEDVRVEALIEQPDESLLAESFIQQFRPFEKTVCFSKGLKDLEGSFAQVSPQPSPEPNDLEKMPEQCATIEPFKSQRQASTSLATSQQESVTTSLKANAHLWYQQFMEQHNKWKVGDSSEQAQPSEPIHQLCSSVQSDDPPATVTPITDTHKKGLSLNLNCLSTVAPTEQPQLFSFRRERELEPEARYGEFYKKLKKELESL